MSGGPFKGATVRIATQQEREGLVHHEARNVWLTSAVLWQRAVIPAVRCGRYDAIIMLGDPHYLSTWAGALVARMRGTPVLFWSHGIKRQETGLTRIIKRAFYALADAHLVYDRHARTMMRSALNIKCPIVTIWNSLDFDRQDEILAQLENASTLFKNDTLNLISIGRLTPRRRIDTVICALAALRKSGMDINLTIIGDGPERGPLEALARSLRVNDGVDFMGAVYDEVATATALFKADLMVSPGPIGLPAVHAHSLGCPVLTVADRTIQMPEVEVIVPGETGILIESITSEAVQNGIRDWFAVPRDRAAIRRRCRAEVAARWTPPRQKVLIEGAVQSVLHDTIRQNASCGSGQDI